MVLQRLFNSSSGKDTLHSHCSGPLRHRALWRSGVILGRCLVMAGHSVLTLWKENAWQQLWSSWTELFESLEFYSEDGLEMTIGQWHWGDFTHSLFRSSRTQSALSWQGYTWNMILKWLLVTLGKRLHIHC